MQETRISQEQYDLAGAIAGLMAESGLELRNLYFPLLYLLADVRRQDSSPPPVEDVAEFLHTVDVQQVSQAPEIIQ